MHTFHFEQIDLQIRCIEFTVRPFLRLTDKQIRSSVHVPFLPDYANRDLLSYLYSLKRGDQVDWVRPYNCGEIFGGQYYAAEVDFQLLQKAIDLFLQTGSGYDSFDNQGTTLSNTEHEQQSLDPRLIYAELLKTPDWKKRRFEILIRDQHKCQMCGVFGKFCIQDRGLMLSYHTLEDMDEKRLQTLNKAFSITSSYQLPFISLYDHLGDKEVEPTQFRETILQVHHKYYILNAVPWDYPDQSMITLCKECHKMVHTPKVPMPVMVRRADKLEPDPDLFVTDCGKCEGQGYIEDFKHYKGGICFDCHGEGYVIVPRQNTVLTP